MSRTALLENTKEKKARKISFEKWGIIFIIPFFIIFFVFSLIPLFQTVYYSFFQYFNSGLEPIGPNFIGLDNYVSIFTDPMFWKYLLNTLIIWIIGFIPQILLSLLLAVWFTDIRLKLRCQHFFKTVIYMPNLVMAAAFGMLFLMLFSQNGPIMQFLVQMNIIPSAYDVTTQAWWVRGIIAFINFLIWFGNTTIMLMAGVMGIDQSVFESAQIDGAGAFKVFWKVTFPLLMPIFVYVFITSLIGGIQLFDVAQIFTRASGGPDMTSKTIMMYLFTTITGPKNYGLAGAISVIMFVLTSVLSFFVYKIMVPSDKVLKQEESAKRKRLINELKIAKEEALKNGKN